MSSDIDTADVASSVETSAREGNDTDGDDGTASLASIEGGAEFWRYPPDPADVRARQSNPFEEIGRIARLHALGAAGYPDVGDSPTVHALAPSDGRPGYPLLDPLARTLPPEPQSSKHPANLADRDPRTFVALVRDYTLRHVSAARADVNGEWPFDGPPTRAGAERDIYRQSAKRASQWFGSWEAVCWYSGIRPVRRYILDAIHEWAAHPQTGNVATLRALETRLAGEWRRSDQNLGADDPNSRPLIFRRQMLGRTLNDMEALDEPTEGLRASRWNSSKRSSWLIEPTDEWLAKWDDVDSDEWGIVK